MSNFALVPTNADELGELAKRVSGSQLLPTGVQKSADIAVIMLAGMELGLKPMQAIRNIHVIKGKPVLSADLITALVMRSPECKWFRLVESTSKRACYATLRAGYVEPIELDFTWNEAEHMGLTTKDNWKRMPRQMLRARCKAALCREVYPEHAMGLFDPDELDHSEPGIGTSPGIVEGVVTDTPNGPMKIKRVGGVHGIPVAERYHVGSPARQRDEFEAQQLPDWAGGALPVCPDCGARIPAAGADCESCGVCPTEAGGDDGDA